MTACVRKGDSMKKKILNELWLFAKIDIICWIIYFASYILILLIFYQDVPPGKRDYTVVSWTQHIIFFGAYHIIFSNVCLHFFTKKRIFEKEQHKR